MQNTDCIKAGKKGPTKKIRNKCNMNRQRKFNKTRSPCLGGNRSWKQYQDKLPARIAIVPHEVGGMTMVENPTQGFRKHIRRIYDSRKVNQNDVLHKSPML